MQWAVKAYGYAETYFNVGIFSFFNINCILPAVSFNLCCRFIYGKFSV